MNKKFALLMLGIGLVIGLVQLHYASAEETLIWSGDVPSNGNPVITSVILEAGKQYRIVAKEIFWYSLPNWGLAADAQYYTTGDNGWNWVNYFPAPDGHSFLQINEQDVNWGPFSNGDTGHTYSMYYIGTGSTITFRIVDWIDRDYTNNGCHLPVEIYELPPPPKYEGLTPGFWKNHLEAWIGYLPSQSLDDVFDNDPTGVPLSEYTLLDALRFKGGRGTAGAERILLRAAVAAILNAAHPDINYPLTTAEIIEAVNEALQSDDRAAILELAQQLDNYNNLGL